MRSANKEILTKQEILRDRAYRDIETLSNFMETRQEMTYYDEMIKSCYKRQRE